MKTWKELLTPKVLLNSIIAGGLVFLGACSGGTITMAGIWSALAGAGVAFLTQLRESIFPESKKGSLRLFEFI